MKLQTFRDKFDVHIVFGHVTLRLSPWQNRWLCLTWSFSMGNSETSFFNQRAVTHYVLFWDLDFQCLKSRMTFIWRNTSGRGTCLRKIQSQRNVSTRFKEDTYMSKLGCRFQVIGFTFTVDRLPNLKWVIFCIRYDLH